VLRNWFGNIKAQAVSNQDRNLEEDGVCLLRLSRFTVLLSFFMALSVLTVSAESLRPELLQLFPEHVAAFKRTQLPSPPDDLKRQGILNPSSEPLGGQVEYVGDRNRRFLVEIVRSHQDAEAYSLLSLAAAVARMKQSAAELSREYGTAGFVSDNQVAFFKGLDFVRITSLNKSQSSDLEAFAAALAKTIDKGEADIPALIKHLPNTEHSQKIAIFLTRFNSLQTLMPNQTVLSAVETGGDADAAFVDTGSGKVVLVEYNTPQLAKDNDERIIGKIHELWKLGQSAPVGYRRVGNYSVFVFDAPDEATAKQLIDQVKYEQVVQWLGENPNILKEAERRYVETTLGVFVAVVKASGVALVGCLGLGGLIGALLFNRRRAQQRTQEAFSDAGGMLRLNIDELTPQTDPGRLLGPRR
jgi:hypothetical protein